MSQAIAGILDKLERATGPDQKIDMEIFALERGWSFPLFGAAWEEWSVGNREGVKQNYTASIDAALALVPEGMDYVLRSLRNNAEARVGGAKFEYLIKSGQHPLPAIALCIAALKARDHQQSQKVTLEPK